MEWERLIDKRVKVVGRKGEYLMSLGSDALIVTKEDGKPEFAIPFRKLKSVPTVVGGKGKTLELDTEDGLFLLQTSEPDLWRLNLERKMMPDEHTGVY